MKLNHQVKQHITLPLLLAGSLLSSIAAAADLSVKIENLKSSQGTVRVALFNTATDFTTKPLKGAVAAATQDTLIVVFKDLPEGTYAVSAFHDLNSNEKLDTNAVGRPTEPYGFSNNVRGLFGPPSFDSAAFKVQVSENTINVKLK